jgi:uncharacterized protein (TIGR02996 family)
VEERALYRAILDAPQDDAPRLVYADWLDEHADSLSERAARSERARAEFIRLQCALARLVPEGWRVWRWPFASAQAKRERLLLFRHGKKWRRAFPVTVASNPFDRGFLRPFRALRPHEFLDRLPEGFYDNPHMPFDPAYRPLPPLAMNCSARRYVPEGGDLWLACPLWDVHLYASTWGHDRLADHGQYAALLTEVGNSPRMERVGWLKVSFFGTPVYDFLRTGHFPNVETLVLNAGPFPDVLEAVSENESFRCLRYVQFGSDPWAWAPGYVDRLRFTVLEGKLRAANAKHLPFGEMRTALRAILRSTPLVPANLPPPAVPLPLRMPEWATSPPPGPPNGKRLFVALLFVLYGIGLVFRVVIGVGSGSKSPPTTPDVKIRYEPASEKRQPATIDVLEKSSAPSEAKPRQLLVPARPKAEDRSDFVGPPRPAEPKDRANGPDEK